MIMKKTWISKQLCIADASFTCNLYCKYCHSPPKGERKDIDYIIDIVKKAGVDAVSLEGQGDPLTNPNILLLIQRLKKQGIRHIMISTNGINLSDIELCKKLKDDIEFFVINFTSHIEKIYNSLTRSVKYNLATKALDNLKFLGILNKVRIFHIINKENYKYLGDFVDWIKNNYRDIFLLNFVFIRNEGRVNNSKKIVPKYSEVYPYLKLALLKSKLYRIKSVIQNMPLCVIPGLEGFSFEFHRYRRGDKVLEDGIADKMKNSKCEKCLFEIGCCGARKDYIKIYGDSELKTIKKSLNEIKPEAF